MQKIIDFPHCTDDYACMVSSGDGRTRSMYKFLAPIVGCLCSRCDEADALSGPFAEIAEAMERGLGAIGQ